MTPISHFCMTNHWTSKTSICTLIFILVPHWQTKCGLGKCLDSLAASSWVCMKHMEGLRVMGPLSVAVPRHHKVSSIRTVDQNQNNPSKYTSPHLPSCSLVVGPPQNSFYLQSFLVYLRLCLLAFSAEFLGATI